MNTNVKMRTKTVNNCTQVRQFSLALLLTFASKTDLE